MYEFLGIGLTYEELNDFQKHKADWIEKMDRYALNTKKVYWSVLNLYVNFVELHKNKDLYEWDKEEIIQIIKNIPSKAPATQRTLYSVVVRYIEWAYKEGIKTGENPCDTINTSELFTIDELILQNSYKALQEFYEFILELNCSDVDRAMLTLLRYGVKIDDVGTVRWEDVDRESKVIKVFRGDIELKLPIDNLFIMIINQAKACDRYAPGQKMVEYVDYGYIIKATPTVSWKSIDKLSVYNKVGVISRNNKIQRISVPELNMNRRYDLLFNILNNYGKVTKLDIERVIEVLGDELTVMKAMSLRQNFELISGTVVEWKRKNRTN
ncbi:hypothetical protein [Clostridium beijerinckii]|uniref:Integrase n=1 Tax=Clostridium beijerinckii TaxID=1520 RepID=A0A9Q5CJ10_CLOBE|nr:hypothetical protein [Clostridium beijerinckii]AQS04003.1 hypothetical protein CLBIJ_14180 [Clostridium beijerinckii]MBA2884114.1 integrase [Clostridium beijerinckii]MBA2899297.1 integrase [Clostridium beijerinckii]MBA2908699.1 integrase [Clostridium beijerinckii]MBA9016451.1 integrase [Clostridium beijerinckii]